jgi:fatty acid desaturase
VLKQFLSDPRFLLRYYAICVLFLATTAVLLAHFSDSLTLPYYWILMLGLVPLVIGGSLTIGITWACLIGFVVAGVWGELTPYHLLLIPGGILLGLYSGAVMHVVAHGSLRPPWLNRVIGELCATQQMIGFFGWGIPHLIHHKYPDDPAHDPHPPGQLGYWAYGRQMKASIVRCLDDNYFQAFRQSNQTLRIWRLTKVLLFMNRYLRGAVMLLLFGPIAFVFLILTSYVAQMLFYVHFNWATHQIEADGHVVIKNRVEGAYYHVMNSLLFGMYYHRNHHLCPTLVDPRNYRETTLARESEAPAA